MRRNNLSNLEKYGFCSNEQGDVLLLNESEIIFHRLVDYLYKLFKPYYNYRFQVPKFISKDTLKISEYSNNFPHHLIKCHNKLNDSNDFYITPASCLHIYQYLKDKVTPRQNDGYMVLGDCGRFENGNWEFPFRLKSFHMLELVLFGSQHDIDYNYKSIINLCEKNLKSIGIRGKFYNATDSFFVANSRGAKLIQQIKGLKKEFRANINGHSVALLSVNRHEDYFVKKFNIKMRNVAQPESMCIAFGLERLVAYGILKWGNNQNKWPGALRR